MSYFVGMHSPKTNKTPKITGSKTLKAASSNAIHAYGTSVTRGIPGAHRLNPMGNHK